MTDMFATKLARRDLFRLGAAGLAGAGAFRASRFMSGQPAAAAVADGPAIEDARYEGLREQLGRFILLTPQKLG
jgi:hypothetical protein